MLLCLARPLPFCRHGFRPPPLTSARTLVLAWLILLKFFCQISTWCRMSSLGGRPKTSGCSSAIPSGSSSGLSKVWTQVRIGLRWAGTEESHDLRRGRGESGGGGGRLRLLGSTRLVGSSRFGGRADSPAIVEANLLAVSLPHREKVRRIISVSLARVNIRTFS